MKIKVKFLFKDNSAVFPNFWIAFFHFALKKPFRKQRESTVDGDNLDLSLVTNMLAALNARSASVEDTGEDFRQLYSFCR